MSMKTALLFLSSICWHLGSMAQPTFEAYYLAGGIATMSLNEQSSGNLVTGVGGCTLLNPQGHLLNTHTYDVNPMTNVQAIRRMSDNEMCFVAGYIYDSCQVGETLKVDPVIGRMDSLGNVSAVQGYALNSLTCVNTAQDLVVMADRGLVVWGRAESFFTLRVDSAGTPVWSKQFTSNGCVRFIKELPGGDLLAGFTMDMAGVVVARLTAAGEILWSKSYIRPTGMVWDCVVESDSSFVLAGYTERITTTDILVVPPDYSPKLFLMSLNGTGAVQWCKGFIGEPGWHAQQGPQIVKAHDGNYVVLANTRDHDANFPYRPFLLKADQNGDTLWSRSFGMTNYTYGTADLLSSSDGGFYFDGIAYGSFGSWTGAAYLFKTDSLGHLPCYERTHPVQVMDLFPIDSSFTLTFLEGAVQHPVFATDASFPPIMVYDGCTFSTSMRPAISTPRKFSARPNPTFGHFSIAFQDPLAAESFYSVYDAMGKLLHQRPLSTGATLEEVDLSHYGKGTYVIKFTDKTGVCYERVVLE